VVTPGETAGCTPIQWSGERSSARHELEPDPSIQNWYGGLVGGMRDASGQTYRRNRYYDPKTGQFTQAVPSGGRGSIICRDAMTDRETTMAAIGVMVVIFSAVTVFVVGRFGTRALWPTAASQGVFAMALLWAVGWAQTPESPLYISVVMVAAGILAIVTAAWGFRDRHPLVSILAASVSGVIATYAGIFVGYVTWVSTS
jgi:hypothetical protein